jgi:hypothetical protein
MPLSQSFIFLYYKIEIIKIYKYDKEGKKKSDLPKPIIYIYV